MLDWHSCQICYPLEINLLYKVINQVISYWLSYRSKVCCIGLRPKITVTGSRSAVLVRGRRPRANTASRGPVTGTIRNYLINHNFVN